MGKSNLNITAVILARGGSKGIPGKNIIEFCGHPLIAWTIMDCHQSGITSIYVSTDNYDIGRVSTEYGARVITRPAELAGDTSSGDDALIHAANELGLQDETVLVMPQVTSPLRWPIHIASLVKLVAEDGYDSAFTATRIDDIGVWTLDDSPKSITYDFRERVMRQDRPALIVENGSAYCTRVGALRGARNRLSGSIGVSLMPKWTLNEIDDPEDIQLCEALMEVYRRGHNDTMIEPKRSQER